MSRLITTGRGEALAEADECLFMAALAASDAARDEYRRLARRWLRLADSYRLAERVSGHIEWRARRLRD
jgi:hypothetical protein